MRLSAARVAQSHWDDPEKVNGSLLLGSNRILAEHGYPSNVQ